MDDPSAVVKIRLYADRRGWTPFGAWLDGLGDRLATARIRVRIERLRMGNWGDFRAVGEGVVELRIDHGPGYRIYVGRQDTHAVVLLGGGNKKTQNRDIALAKARWADCLRRSREALP